MDEVPEDAKGAGDRVSLKGLRLVRGERAGTAGVGTGELPGPKGRIPRDPPQRDSGNGGRALIDTGYVGGEARDAAVSRVREKLDLQSGRGRRVVDVEEQTPHHEMPNGGGHPLGALGAQGSSAKHGDSVSGNARREVRQGAELGIARIYDQVPPRRNAVGQVQLLLSEGALQTGAESIRDPKVVSPGQAARVRVGQLHSQAPGQGSTTAQH